ncbi:MAG TPA: gamma-glutamyltransferase [Wenzhouxiangella sp.]
MMKKTLCCIALISLQFAVGAVAQVKPNSYAVSSAHELATEAGLSIMAQGGNAYDAAVAVSAALAVVEPASSGIGGGGFWILQSHDDSLSTMVDGREVAPGAAHRDMYLDDEGNVNRDLAVNGGLAAGIPGAPAAWVYIAENYGTLPLADLLAPAIDLAANGYPADEKYVTLLAMREEVMNRWPETAAIFMPEGKVPEVGDLIIQTDLANTLRAIVENGRDGFYKGEVAERLVEGTRAAGGIWTLDDLAGYTVKEREPITTTYKGYELITAPPPSSGGIAIAQMLNLIEAYDVEEMSSVERTHLLSEAMRRAYRDRALYLGDTDFVDVPIDLLLSKDYAAGMRTNLRLDRATPSSMLADDPDIWPEGNNTTHFSLIDAEGNMVSATLTVNLAYGAAYVPPGTGVLLNNEMDDFSAKPGEPNAFGLVGFEANAIEPYKRMLSSMSPTIVRSPERVAVIGTPGGSRIITMVFLGLLDFIDGHGPESWVAVPRFHHQYLPDQIYIEPGSMDADSIQALEALGHTVEEGERTWGNMHGVMWDLRTNEMEAAHDPRWTSGGAEVVPVKR